MARKKIKVLVLGGGPSSEHEVSLKTAEMVHQYLDRSKYEPTLATITKKGEWLLPSGKNFSSEISLAPPRTRSEFKFRGGRPHLEISSEKFFHSVGSFADVVFIAMHGEFGEDGQVQAILDSAGVPYTGSGAVASALGMDKIRSQQVFSSNGLNMPESMSFGASEFKNKSEQVLKNIENKFSAPLVVKPADRGSSVGVSIVKKITDLGKAVKKAAMSSENILVQEFIPGVELTCGVLDDGKNNLTPLLPTEIVPKLGDFFDYKSKYAESGSDEITPAEVPHDILAECQGIALKTHVLIGCSGFSRTDMIWAKDRAKIYILEINTIPGLTARSLLPKAAAASGISFSKLLDHIIKSALAKQNQ
ncbi:D-alanine--D-alanine ligase [Candidatus Giovannonibacteria bacterium]|nr:D-alanine--D-alanine ligase [Candidatus Giovannonibacteria bacterium]